MLFVSTFDVWVCITHCSTVIALMCVTIQYVCMMCIVSYSSVEYFNYLINGTEFMYSH